MNIEGIGGMPKTGLPSRAVSLDTETGYANKHAHMVVVQVYAISKCLYRTALNSKGFSEPVAMVEMRMHSPGAKSLTHQVSRIWVAVPITSTHLNSRNSLVNYSTALSQMNKALLSTTFNIALVTGTVVNGLVPDIGWDNEVDGLLTEDQLLSKGKLVESHILLANSDGVVPALSYDHSRTDLKGDLNYENNRIGANGIKLASHPLVNVVSGYFGVNLANNIEPFYKIANIKLGLVAAKDSGILHYSFIGNVFATGLESSQPISVAFDVHDNVVRDNNENSKATSFSAGVIPNHVNEFTFNGSLRVGSIKGSNASIFRFQIINWKGYNASSVLQEDHKPIEIGIISHASEIPSSEDLPFEDGTADEGKEFEESTLATQETGESLSDLEKSDDLDEIEDELSEISTV